MEEKDKKIITSQNTPKKTKEEILRSREDLINDIITRVEEQVQKQFTDDYIDRKNLIHKLRSGVEIDLEKIEFVTNILGVYEKRFPQEYYRAIFNLNKDRGAEWQIPENGIISKKPHIVGKWTKEIIYSRFGPKVLPRLEIYNPCILIGIRKFKHHQFLDKEGLIKLDQFINEAVSVMEASKNWYDFRVNLYKEHDVPYQLDIYEEQKRG